MPNKPIEGYGIIGGLNTVALMGMEGSIVFMALCYFNAPTIFAAFLNSDNGGFLRIAPSMECRRHMQLYLSDTNVLLTRFLFNEEVAELSDFMPVQDSRYQHRVVRRVKEIRGGDALQYYV